MNGNNHDNNYKVITSIYFDENVYNALDKFASGIGKSKTKIANYMLAKIFNVELDIIIKEVDNFLKTTEK